MTSWRIALVLLAGIVLVTATPAGADMVRMKDGSWLVARPAGDRPTQDEIEGSNITVVFEQYDDLVYVIKNVKTHQKRTMAEVEKVYYAKSDPSYQRAAGLMGEGDFEGALEALDRAVNSAVTWVPQYAMWDRARIFENLGQPQEAIKALEMLIKKSPKSKFLIKALIKSARIYLEHLGDANKAASQFRRIRAIPKINEEVAAEVDYWLIFIDEQRAISKSPVNKSEINGVKERYKALLGKAEIKFPNVATKARLGIGRSLVTLDEFEKALEFFKAIVDEIKESNGEVLAGAYVGIGDAYFKMEKWLEARRAYLRVGVLWEDYPEYHAKALCLAGNCFLLARDKDFKARARQELQDCIRRYRGSTWANKAQDLLARIR
jgi:tetratricopeptide (TPR) repeat protein